MEPRTDASKRRVLLIRHGRGPHQDGGEHLDPLLTDVGRAQASSWAAHIGRFKPDLVLVSPLKRAVETACLVFSKEDVPLRLCRRAREGWWECKENKFGPAEKLQDLLEKYGRGTSATEQRAMHGVDEALLPDDPASFKESVADLYKVLASTPKNTIAVVCHWGVINQLCRASARNCQLVVCEFGRAGGLLEAVQTFQHPGDMFQARVRAIENCIAGGLYFKRGDEGFCITDEGGERVEIYFDNGKLEEPLRRKFEIVFEIGTRLTTTCGDRLGRYREGEIGTYRGWSDTKNSCAVIEFEVTGKTEHVQCSTLEPIVEKEVADSL